MNDMKTLKKIFFLIIMSFSLCVVTFADWVYSADKKTSEKIDNKIVDPVKLTVHYMQESNEITTTTKYYKPDTVTVDTSEIQKVLNADGTQATTKFEADRYKKGQNGDERPLYTDNGKLINEHDINSGEEQFTSVTFTVNTWKEATSMTDYGDVWNASKDGHRFRFACDVGNNSFASTHGQKYKIGDLRQEPKEIEKETIEEGNKTITRIYYQRVVVDDVGDLVYGQNKKVFYFDYKIWYYFTTFQQLMVETTVTKGQTDMFVSEKEFSVNKGDRVSPIDLGLTDYDNYGYFSDENESSFFDFSLPITENKDIYIRYVKKSNNDLNSKISGKTCSLYDSNKGGTAKDSSCFNVAEESSYHQKSNTIFLKEAEVSAGNTLNLTYGNSSVYIDKIDGNIGSSDSGTHKTSLDSFISEKYDNSGNIENKNRSLNLKLCGNLTIKGTMQIGAMIGASSEQKYSYIIDKYTALDLYGHDVIIDGGSLIALGVVEDTIGGGKIIVKNGGKILATASVSDGRGGRHIALSVSKRQTPFSEYQFAYLRVPVIFYNGTSFKGLFSLYFSDFGIINAHIEVIGKEGLFSWRDNTAEDYVRYDWEMDDKLYSQGDSLKRDLYYQRNKFTLHANIKQNASYSFQGQLNISSNTIDFVVDFGRIDFPISTFWDLVLDNGYDLDLYCKMTMYPGSSLIAQKGSTINFKVTGQKKYAQMGKSIVGIGGVVIPGETRYLCGGINAYLTNIQSTSRFSCYGFSMGVYGQGQYWNYIKPSNVYIQGNISFDNSINVSTYEGHYFISGKINLSKTAMNALKENSSFVKTYDAKAELVSSFLYSGDYHGTENEYMIASSFNISPLISNGKAYLIDGNYDLSGTFNPDNGVFIANRLDAYILKMDLDLYEDGSSSSNQGSKVDRTIEIQKLTSFDLDKKLVSISDTNYLYFCGVFVPLQQAMPEEISNGTIVIANIRKFMSNNSTGSYVRTMIKYTKGSDGQFDTGVSTSVKCAGEFEKVNLKYNSQYKSWSFYEFYNYPKTGESVYYRY